MKEFSNTTKIFQPKLLKLRDTQSFHSSSTPLEVVHYSSNLNKNKTEEKAYRKLKKYDVSSIESVNEGKVHFHTEENSLQEKLQSYYKNPFQYMDHIIEKYRK